MSDAINSSTRRLKLVTFIQSKRYVTVDEIAAEYGISRRTVFRDIIALSEMGIPLSSDRDRGYSINSSHTMPPFMFTEKELSTLMVGLGYLKGQVDQGLSQSARDVELMILSKLNSDQKSYIRAISQSIILYPYYHERVWEKTNESWYDILTAIHKRNTISCTYHSLGQNKTTARTIDPYLLVYYTDHWDLIGKCHDSNSLRTFVLKRISDLRVDHKSYFTRDGLGNDEIIHRNASNNLTMRVKVSVNDLDRLLLGLPAKIVDIDQQATYAVVTFDFDNVRWMNQWLLQFGASVTILEPTEMIEDRKKLLLELLA